MRKYTQCFFYAQKRGDNIPARIKSECRKIGCTTLTDNANGYCDRHQPKQNHRRYDANRLSSCQRGYDAKWQRYRRWFLAQHPLCAVCNHIATVVDHITPHRGDKEVFWDSNNHQALCKRCHDAKTATEDGGFGNTGKNGVGGKNPWAEKR